MRSRLAVGILAIFVFLLFVSNFVVDPKAQSSSTPQFDTCLQDDRTSDTLQFNSLTGDYRFIRRFDGFVLTGKGLIKRIGCLLILQDASRVSASIDKCAIAPKNTGNATVRPIPILPVIVINDSNITNNTCAPSAPQNRVVWNPLSITHTSLIGTTSSVQISFTSDTQLSNVRVVVAPALAPFISPSASILDTVPAGMPQSLTLFFTVPGNTPVQALAGTIQLMVGSTAIASPLPVMLDTKRATATEIPSTIALPSPDRVVSGNNTSFVKDEIVIIFKDGTASSKVVELVSNIQGVLIGSVPKFNIYQVQFSIDGFANLSSLVDRVELDPAVSVAIHHFLFIPAATQSKCPNSGLITDSASLINLPAALSIAPGNRDVIIAVIDTVFQADHPDLIVNQCSGICGNIPTTLNPPISYVHGTSVAGVIGAKSNGVMRDVSLHLYSTISPINGKIDGVLLSAAIFNAIKDGAKVINYSSAIVCKRMLCDDEDIRTLKENDRFFSDYIKQSPNVLWVFASGDNKQNLLQSVPARLSMIFPNVVSVSAVDSKKQPVSDWVNGQGITVSAPGVDIYTPVPISGHDCESGTSVSAPFVSGVAGLMLSANPNLTAAQLKTIIHDTADVTGNLDPDGNAVLLLNAGRAVQRAKALFHPLVTFLAFTQGDSGLPGDGKTVTFKGFFPLAQPFPLAGTTDGITITVFPLPNTRNIGLVNPIIGASTPSSNCQSSFGGLVVRTSPVKVVLNGVQGYAFNVSQADLADSVDVVNLFTPGCGFTLKDIFIDQLVFDESRSAVLTLDALAIGLGQNNFPGTRIQ